MEEPDQVLGAGTKVITHEVLGSITGMLVKQHHLDNRRPNTPGVIGGWVPGHGGDVYWVSHEDVPGKPIAVYCWTEFELVPAPPRLRFEREEPV
jgi:hypothetical protein